MKLIKVPGDINRHHVLMYAISTCLWCRKAKMFLANNNVEYEYIDIDRSSQNDREAIRKDDPIFEKFHELKIFRRFRLDHMRLPDAAIFLDVAPAVSIQRIQSRGEQRQVHETEEKLAKLREGYLLVSQVIEKEFNIPTRVLEGELEIERLTASAIEFVKGSNLREPEYEQ